MGWTNYHGHCNYCDGYAKMEAYILKAITDKMPVIGFSSHAPVPFDCFWTMKEDLLPRYIQELSELKIKYKSDITILSSLEIDYLPEFGGFSSILADIKLDYKIGSIHFMGKFEGGDFWAIDGSYTEFKKGLVEIYNNDIVALVKHFFVLNREMIRNEEFDIIGHIDKIKMHNIDGILFDETAEWYQNEVDETLDLIASKGVIVEINTKSFERNGLLFPGVNMFTKLKEKDIDITINSDSHYPDKQQCGYSFVAKKLKEAGFEYLKEFKSGMWMDIKFDKEGLLWE